MDIAKLTKDAAWLLANPDKDLRAEYHDAGSCWQLINLLREQIGAQVEGLENGAICGTCGFRYQGHKGHIIPCPVCKIDALQVKG